MAVKIKFPLNMADGTAVRTIEELREHFDLASVLSYYSSGKLINWLESRYYDEEANKIRELDALSENFKISLCEILGVTYYDNEAESINLSDISKRNDRIELLKKYTANDEVIESIDKVAFTTEEMDSLIQNGYKTIYLCGECFTIHSCIEGTTYIGVNKPTVKFEDTPIKAGVDIQNFKFDIDSYISDDGNAKKFYEYFENNAQLASKLLHVSAEQGSAKAQTVLGNCYETGSSVEVNVEKAINLYKKAAEQGYAEAQYALANIYAFGDENGNEIDYNEAVKWYAKAAEQNHTFAQNRLGLIYFEGYGVNQDYLEANKWFLKAAELGNCWAQYNLGLSYKDGNGVEKNAEEAIRWLKKSYENGNEQAKSALIEISPKHYTLSDVIICLLGGEDNIGRAELEVESCTINVMANDGSKVNPEYCKVFTEFGATEVWKEKNYFTYLIFTPKIKLFGLPEDKIDTKVEDLGEEKYYIKFEKINSDMQEDFNNNVKPKCHNGWRREERISEITNWIEMKNENRSSSNHIAWGIKS